MKAVTPYGGVAEIEPVIEYMIIRLTARYFSDNEAQSAPIAASGVHRVE